MSKPAIDHGLSDSTLMALWRKAVLQRGGQRCVVCGHGGQLECHHVIKRRYKLLCYDWRNGVPVHQGDCHDTADKMGTGISPMWAEYLLLQSRWTKKGYLMQAQMSESEWRAQVKAELLREINA